MGLEGGGGNGREMGELGEGVLLRGSGSALRLLLEELLLLEEELLVLELLLLLLRLLRLLQSGALESRALGKCVELFPSDLARVEEVREDGEVGSGHLWRRLGELTVLRHSRRHSLRSADSQHVLSVPTRSPSLRGVNSLTSPVSSGRRSKSRIVRIRHRRRSASLSWARESAPAFERERECSGWREANFVRFRIFQTRGRTVSSPPARYPLSSHSQRRDQSTESSRELCTADINEFLSNASMTTSPPLYRPRNVLRSWYLIYATKPSQYAQSEELSTRLTSKKMIVSFLIRFQPSRRYPNTTRSKASACRTCFIRLVAATRVVPPS